MSHLSGQPLARTVPFGVAGCLGLLALSNGIYGLIRPPAFAEMHGLPLTVANGGITNPASHSYISFIAARNLSSGVGLLALCASGERKATGLVLMAGVATALGDAWILRKAGDPAGNAVGHAIMGLIIGAVGVTLYRT